MTTEVVAGQLQPEDPYAAVDLLPDRYRVANPWLQIIRDMTAPAPMCEWAAEVTSIRIRVFDQIRPFVARGVLLAVTAILVGAAPGTWWLTWVLLMPALFQVVFEIVLDFKINEDEPSHSRLLGKLAEIAERAHTTKLVNFTGVLGFIAVPCNIVAVSYLTGPDDPTWPKVLALAAAAAYGVSGIVSFISDTTHYSPHQSPRRVYRVFRAVRPHVWLIVLVLMTAIVGGSILDGRWGPDTVPLAWALCLFPVAIGMKQRDYERFLRASSDYLHKIQYDAKRELAMDYHNANTEVRDFTRRLSENKLVPAELRVQAATFAPVISLMSEAIDHDQWVRQQKKPSLAGIANKAGSDWDLDLTLDLRLDELRSRNYELAKALIAALLANVGQATSARDGENDRPAVLVFGEVRCGCVWVAVRDPLPLIEDWCHPGSTTLWLHQDLIARGGDGLSQHLVDPANPAAGKEIRANWPVKKPPTRLREIRR